MHPDIHLVIQLQELDTKTAELEREIASLPKHIATIERTLEGHIRKLEADRAALAANQRDRKKLEADIQGFDQKTSKLKDQMLEAKTNEQYRAFQNEIAHFGKEVRRCEDRILELMTESEPLEANVKKAEASLAEEKKSVHAEQERARERTAADKAALDRIQAQRAELVGKLDSKLISAYQRIRKKWRGVVAAEAVEGRCTACQIVLRPQYFQELKRGSEIMFCESCGRILYFNPPVDVEDQMATQRGAPAGRS